MSESGLRNDYSPLVLSIAIAVGACAGTPLALPPPVDRPSFTVGERWIFTGRSGTRSEIVYQGRRGDALVFRLTGSPPEGANRPATVELLRSIDLARITGMAQFTGNAIEYRPDDGSLRFPLAVGESWRRSYVRAIAGKDPPDDEMTVEAAVKAYERITVPAGSFDAFRIESTITSARETNPTLYATYWYAPAAKAVIKYHAEISGSLGLKIEGDELAEYELKP